MRFLSVLSLFLFLGCANSTTKKSTPEVKAPTEETVKTIAVEVAVQGMSCTGCEQTIQSGVGGVTGVKQVKADFKTGRAYVEFIPDVADTNAIREKITASGYVVTGIKTIALDSLRSRL